MENYGNFIVLSEEAKEKIRNMSEEKINLLSSWIYNSIEETQMQISHEMLNKKDE